MSRQLHTSSDILRSQRTRRFAATVIIARSVAYIFLAIFVLSTPALALDWTQECYEASSWPSGNAELGYGDGDEATVVPAGRTTYYFRAAFLVADLMAHSTMTLKVNYDDAFVAYVNGVEVARSANMPSGAPRYSTLALSPHEGGSFETFDISFLITAGYFPASSDYELNLSVEVHQVSQEDEDCSFDAEILLDGGTVMPAGSVTRYYDAANEPGVSRSDPISTILRPLPNLPSFVPRGDTLDIVCKAPDTATNWIAFMKSEFCFQMLSVVSAAYDTPTRRWFLRAPVPEGCPVEMYDLVVMADGVTPDTTYGSVKVVDEYKHDFYFLHVTDSHVPEHYGTSNTVAVFREILNEAPLMNPEFIVHTGDLVNRSYEDQTEMAQILLLDSKVPVFVTSGNHDLGHGMRYWWKYFGWDYLDPYSPDNFGVYTPDYSFDYGQCHFSLPAAYRNYGSFIYRVYGYQSFLAEQMSWIESDLASAAGARLKVMAYHYDFQGQFPPVFSDYGVDLALWGHTHLNSVSYEGNTLTISTKNSYNEGGPVGNTRLIRVAADTVNSYPLIYNFQNITVGYASPNDGTHPNNTATIQNTHAQSFENGLVKFLVPDYGGGYGVTGGSVWQVVDAGLYLVHYVNVNVPAQSTVEVVIEPTEISVPDPTPPPPGITLSGSDPNPFNHWTTIHYEIFPTPLSSGTKPRDPAASHETASATQVVLRVYDALGRVVKELVRLPQGPGSYYASWDGRDDSGRDCASGIYFAVLEAGGEVRTAKLAFLR